jgi:hypothetical protein
MKPSTYRVILRDEKIDVVADHHDYGENVAAMGLRPPLVLTKAGETVAIFPSGEWKGLLVLPFESSNGA